MYYRTSVCARLRTETLGDDSLSDLISPEAYFKGLVLLLWLAVLVTFLTLPVMTRAEEKAFFLRSRCLGRISAARAKKDAAIATARNGAAKPPRKPQRTKADIEVAATARRATARATAAAARNDAADVAGAEAKRQAETWRQAEMRRQTELKRQASAHKREADRTARREAIARSAEAEASAVEAERLAKKEREAEREKRRDEKKQKRHALEAHRHAVGGAGGDGGVPGGDDAVVNHAEQTRGSADEGEGDDALLRRAITLSVAEAAVAATALHCSASMSHTAAAAASDGDDELLRVMLELSRAEANDAAEADMRASSSSFFSSPSSSFSSSIPTSSLSASSLKPPAAEIRSGTTGTGGDDGNGGGVDGRNIDGGGLLLGTATPHTAGGGAGAIECVICFEVGAPRCVLVPCGHLCACPSCSHRIFDCPICRTPIERVQNIYHA